jgi:hypothetical protein
MYNRHKRPLRVLASVNIPAIQEVVTNLVTVTNEYLDYQVFSNLPDTQAYLEKAKVNADYWLPDLMIVSEEDNQEDLGFIKACKKDEKLAVVPVISLLYSHKDLGQVRTYQQWANSCLPIDKDSDYKRIAYMLKVGTKFWLFKALYPTMTNV